MSILFAQFAHDESGATAIEYAMIASVVSLSILVATTEIGGTVLSQFESIVAAFAN